MRVSAPAAVPVGALRAQMPPNDPPMLPLCNPGVARVRSSSFYHWSASLEMGAGTAKTIAVSPGSSYAASAE